MLINPKTEPEFVSKKVDGKLVYKEMLDFNFISDCLKDGKLKNFEKYSLYVNVQDLWSNSKEKKGSKKVKRDSDNETVKLS